jgi:shikimate kinase
MSRVAGSEGLALVGMPGGGKTTVGRHLAKRLGWGFVDSDAYIERRIGTSIRAFFEQEGEAAFRDIESAVIDELTRTKRLVVATGGGAVLKPENRQHLGARCLVVYLHSSPEELHRRLRHDNARPLLQVADPLARLREMYRQRDPLYREVAHFTVETGRPSVSALVNTVLMQLELAGELDPTLARSPVDPPLDAPSA